MVRQQNCSGLLGTGTMQPLAWRFGRKKISDVCLIFGAAALLQTKLKFPPPQAAEKTEESRIYIRQFLLDSKNFHVQS